MDTDVGELVFCVAKKPGVVSPSESLYARSSLARFFEGSSLTSSSSVSWKPWFRDKSASTALFGENPKIGSLPTVCRAGGTDSEHDAVLGGIVFESDAERTRLDK